MCIPSAVPQWFGWCDVPSMLATYKMQNGTRCSSSSWYFWLHLTHFILVLNLSCHCMVVWGMNARIPALVYSPRHSVSPVLTSTGKCVIQQKWGFKSTSTRWQQKWSQFISTHIVNYLKWCLRCIYPTQLYLPAQHDKLSDHLCDVRNWLCTAWVPGVEWIEDCWIIVYHANLDLFEHLKT